MSCPTIPGMAQTQLEKPGQELNREFYDKDKRFVAQFLGVSIWTVDRLVLNGSIPHIKLNHRLVRFKVSDLISYMESQRVA